MSALERYAEASENSVSKFSKSAQMEDLMYTSSQPVMKVLDIDDNEITEPDSDYKHDTNDDSRNMTHHSDVSYMDWNDTGESPQKSEVENLVIDSRLFGIEASKPVKTNLMSVLSGKQSDTKSKKKITLPVLAIETDVDTSIDEEKDDIADSSFTEFKAKSLKKEHELIELERKFYKQGTKSVSSKDFLSRLKLENGSSKELRAPKETKSNRGQQNYIENNNHNMIDLSGTEISNDKPILIDSDSDNEDEMKRLESKVFSDSTKRSSVKELLKPFKIGSGTSTKSVKRGKEKGKEVNTSKFFITLKVNSESLAEIKKYENPLKTRGNFIKITSSDNEIQKKSFDMKSLSSKSFFQSMIEASQSETKLSKHQHKVLHLPIISRNEFHVTPEDQLEHVKLHLPLCSKKLKMKQTSKTIEEGDKSVFYGKPNHKTSVYEIKSFDNNSAEFVKKRISHIVQHKQFTNIYDNFILNGACNNESMLWIDFFQPKCISDVLISSDNQISIANWISKAYTILKTQSLKNPRNLLMKQKRQKQNLYYEMSGFIVDDDAYDYQEYEMDNEIFVPLLIIQGSTGSCKSSSVYAYMNEINGYIYEINSGQQRGKKDIFNNLKEFATTQLVHRQQESKEFQKGLVLFEDVNILYEQDKNFWQVIQEVINITRRPIVLTCNTLDNIPKNLLKYATDENSIINLDNDILPKSILKDYLWLCCISQNFNLNDTVLDDILLDSFNGLNYDLRKCLMTCQYLCSIEKIQSEIRYNTSHQFKDNSKNITLDDLASDLDMASISNIMVENSNTQISQEAFQNEFADISYIDPLTQLKPVSLPYEKNIGKEIQYMIQEDNNIKLPSFTLNTARDIYMEFIGSRAKKIPKLVQDVQNIPRRQTRSARSLTPDSSIFSEFRETTGIMECSLVKFSSNTALVTELLPFSRDWLRFQVTLNQFENEHMKNEEASIKAFLRYRDFHYNSKELLQTLNFYELLNLIDNSK